MAKFKIIETVIETRWFEAEDADAALRMWTEEGKHPEEVQYDVIDRRVEEA